MTLSQTQSGLHIYRRWKAGEPIVTSYQSLHPAFEVALVVAVYPLIGEWDIWTDDNGIQRRKYTDVVCPQWGYEYPKLLQAGNVGIFLTSEFLSGPWVRYGIYLEEVEPGGTVEDAFPAEHTTESFAQHTYHPIHPDDGPESNQINFTKLRHRHKINKVWLPYRVTPRQVAQNEMDRLETENAWLRERDQVVRDMIERLDSEYHSADG